MFQEKSHSTDQNIHKAEFKSISDKSVRTENICISTNRIVDSNVNNNSNNGNIVQSNEHEILENKNEKTKKKNSIEIPLDTKSYGCEYTK